MLRIYGERSIRAQPMSHLWNLTKCMSIKPTQSTLIHKSKMSTNVPLPSIVPDQQQQPAKNVRKYCFIVFTTFFFY